MRAPALRPAALSLLLFSAPLWGQQVTAPQDLAHSAQYRLFTPSAACPVNMDVRHGAGLRTFLPAQKETPPSSPEGFDNIVRTPAPPQSLDVTIHNPATKAIASLDAIIGTSFSDARILLLSSGTTLRLKSGESFRMHLVRTIGADQESQFAWSVLSSNTIAYVEVREITYQDGSAWSAPQQGACHFKLNPIMLVGE